MTVSYTHLDVYKRQVLGNIALFVPLSIILLNYCKCLNNTNIIFISFFTSFSFELIQLSTGWGIFDVDDILLNTIGGIIGLIIYRLFNFKQNNFTSTIFLINFGIIGYKMCIRDRFIALLNLL